MFTPRPLLAIAATLTLVYPSLAGGAADIGVAKSRDLRPVSAASTKPLDQLLHRYVDENGRVDYASWHGNSNDRQQLLRYLRELSHIDPKRGSEPERLAFWINVYNALTIEGILREYPTDSIRNHTAKLFGYNIWDDLRVHVGGRTFSLNQIEHDILRKMGEPRIHFAIVCASKGCPPLRNEAYTAERLHEQLDENARVFFTNSSNFRVVGRTVYLSSILDWFEDDFGEDQTQRMQLLSRWISPEQTIPPAAKVKFLDYDWSLNSQ